MPQAPCHSSNLIIRYRYVPRDIVISPMEYRDFRLPRYSPAPIQALV